MLLKQVKYSHRDLQQHHSLHSESQSLNSETQDLKFITAQKVSAGYTCDSGTFWMKKSEFSQGKIIAGRSLISKVFSKDKKSIDKENIKSDKDRGS